MVLSRGRVRGLAAASTPSALTRRSLAHTLQHRGSVAVVKDSDQVDGSRTPEGPQCRPHRDSAGTTGQLRNRTLDDSDPNGFNVFRYRDREPCCVTAS